MKKLFEGNVLTIPNLLSFLRLLLIPWFVWTYLVQHNTIATVLILLLSGATDVVDGFVARRFQMVSNLGKALDPLADKLTQAAMLICLTSRYPLMLLPFGMMVVKEIFCIASGLAAINRTGEVEGSDWHGKAATVLLYITLLVHLLWTEVPPRLTLAMVIGCMGLILLSGVLYGIQNFNRIAAAKGEKG